MTTTLCITVNGANTNLIQQEITACVNESVLLFKLGAHS